ncbi:hypothetical protein Tco_0646759 [Tanacetum coccineum]
MLVQIQALVDKKKVIITETSIRSDLHIEDAEGTECLPNATIFKQLTLMGAKTTAWNEFSSTMASAVILFLDKQVEGMTKHKEIYVTPSHTKKVFDNMKRRGKDFAGRDTPLFPTMIVQAQEQEGEGFVMPIWPSGSTEPITDEAANEEHVPIHSNDPLLSVLDLENTKTAQATEITKLKERVKKLERRNKSRTPGLKRLRKVGISTQVVSSKDEGLGAQEDASKQGRKIANLDADAEVTLVDEAQKRNDDNLMFDTGVLDDQEVKVEKVVSTAEVTTTSATTTVDELTLAQTLIEIKVAKPKVVTVATTTTTTVVTRPKARRVVVQEPNYELAQRLQAEEQGELTIEERSKLFVELMDKRKKHFAKLRAKEIRRKPPTKAQMRNQMCTYLKNMANYKHKRSKKRTREELESDNSKKQKIYENVEAEVDDEAEMKKLMEIVPDNEVAIDAIPLASKSPIIVDWKIINKGKIGYFQIIKADGSSKRPEETYEIVLWGDVKVMFEPDVESEVWRNLQGYNVTVFSTAEVITICWKVFCSTEIDQKLIRDEIKIY